MVSPGKRRTPSARQHGVARTLRLELQRQVEAPGVARAAVNGMCHDLDLSPSHCHTLLLLVSEVVSNAVLHSRAPADAAIVLTASVEQGVIRVAVTDAGDWSMPKVREATPFGGGYGLYLLDKAASRWGVDRPGGTRVWFELAFGG